jgi:hypothetical protein
MIKNKKILFPCVVFILLLFILTGCSSDPLIAATRFIKKTYGVDLPQNTKLEYSFITPESFHGDGVKYYVFKFETLPIDLINDFQSLNMKDAEQNSQLKTEMLNYFHSAISLEKGNIDTDYIPDWDKEYEWNYGKRLGGMPAVYYPDTLTLIVCKYMI